MKALVLAGGYAQIALIDELKRRGIYTLLADYYAEPVAKPYADKFFQVSTLDVEKIQEIAQSEAVDFLITACTDQALLTVAKVSENLGLPCYVDYETARNVTNKKYMKDVFLANGIPTAKHVTIHKDEPYTLPNLSFPLIVKPADCNSSKGVRKVTNMAEFKAALADAVNFSRTGTAVAEEFIEGPELSIDVWVEEGKAHVLCVSNSEKIADADKFVIFRGNYPAKESVIVQKEVEAVAQKIADAFGIKNAPMLIQAIYRDGHIFVLEFSARTGGGVKYLMIQNASGFDVIQGVVDLTLGQIPHVGDLGGKYRYISNEFVYCQNGVFDKLVGFEELKRNGVIVDYYLFKWQGAQMTGIQSSGDRVCGFTIGADSIGELQQKHKTATAAVKVLDVNGTDIMRHDLLPDIKE